MLGGGPVQKPWWLHKTMRLHFPVNHLMRLLKPSVCRKGGHGVTLFFFDKTFKHKVGQNGLESLDINSQIYYADIFFSNTVLKLQQLNGSQ